jgi:hypothetical protein
MKLLLFFTIVFCELSSSAQVITSSIEDRSRYLLHTIKWTLREKQGFKDGNNVIQIEKTGTKLQTGYTVRLDGTKHAVIIHKTDPTGREIAINKLEGGERVFGPIPTKPIEFGGKILLFYFKYLDKDSMKFYVSEVDRSSLQLINTKHLFSYQQDNVGVFKMMKALDRVITPYVSEDESKLLVVFPGNKEEFFSCVFDTNLQIIRQKTSKLAGIEDLTVSDVYLDNNGNSVIALSKEIFSSETFNSTITKKILIQKSNNTERLTDAETWASGVELHNARFKGSKDQTKIYVFGDHSGTVANGGIWLSEIQSDKLNVTKPKTFSYPEDFKRRVYDIGFGERKRGDYGIVDADLQLTEFENGDLAICGSPLLRHDGTSTDINGKVSGYISFFAGPVMMAFLKGKNEPVFTMIPRYQNYCGGSTSLFIPYQDKLVIIYNDYAKYINDELTDKVNPVRINMVRELSLAGAVVNKNGKIESRKMLAEGIARMNFYDISSCEFLSDKKLLIPSVSADKKTDEMKVVVVTVE